VRPHGLTDEAPTGQITAAQRLPERGQVPRADVAATLLGCLNDPATIGVTFEIVSGDTPIAQALSQL